MPNDAVIRRTDELRRLLKAGSLDATGPIELYPGHVVAAALAVRIVLADVEHLEMAGITGPTRWGSSRIWSRTFTVPSPGETFPPAGK